MLAFYQAPVFGQWVWNPSPGPGGSIYTDPNLAGDTVIITNQGPDGGVIVYAGYVVFDATGSPSVSPILGPGARMIWFPNEAAFRVGAVTGSQWDPSSNVGLYSFATGYDCIASGQMSFAFGDNTNASSDYSFAGGSNTSAGGNGSFAMGNTTAAIGDNSMAIGLNTQTNGQQTFTMGTQTTANGTNSAAFGDNTLVTVGGTNGVAFGDNTTVTGANGISGGFGTLANATNSMALGLNTQSDGDNSLALGDNTQTTAGADNSLSGGSASIANGINSISFGDNNATSSSALNGVSFGEQNLSNAPNSISTGEMTQARGRNSITGGNSTITLSPNSIALGDGSSATQINAFASGQNTQANGINSFSGGNNTIANGTEAVAIGDMTTAQGDHSFSTGDGTLGFGINSVAHGLNTQANGDNSFASGDATDAAGLNSATFGELSTASNQNSFAIGEQNQSSGLNSFAGGQFSNSTTTNCFAFGRTVISSGGNSVAMGDQVQANGAHSISLGRLNQSNGFASVTLGESNTGGGDNSVAIGLNTNAAGDASVTIGTDLTATPTAINGMVIGQGASGSPLINTNPSSLMFGLNTDYPSLYLAPGSGAGTYGTIGVGGMGHSSLANPNPLEIMEVWSGNLFQTNLDAIATNAPSNSVGQNFIGLTGVGTCDFFGFTTDNTFAVNPVPNINNSFVRIGVNQTNPEIMWDANRILDFTIDGSTTSCSQTLLFQAGDQALLGGYVLSLNGSAIATGIWFPSDLNYKQDVKKVESPIEKIKKISGYTYSYKTDLFPEKGFDSGQQLGLLAQEVEKVFPECVKTSPDGFKAINYIGLIPVLLEVVKEQQKIIDTLKIDLKQGNSESIESAITNDSILIRLNNLEKENSLKDERINEMSRQLASILSCLQNVNICDSNNPNINNETAEYPLLGQNIPNPFSGYTQIPYFIPSYVKTAKIRLIGTLGNVVQEYDLEKSGNNLLDINLTGLANGTYYYSLIIDGKEFKSLKMILNQR